MPRFPWVLLLATACDGSDDRRPIHTDDTPTDHTADTDTDPPTETDTEPPLPDAAVVINEVMPGNQSTINGPDGDSTPDWVELVNTGDTPVGFERLQLRSKSGGFWEGKAKDGNLRPGEHTLVWFGTRVGSEGVWTDFALDREDDEVTLVLDGETIIDTADVEDLPNDVSLMRLPDLTGDFVATALPSPGAENPDLPSATLDSADETVFRTDVMHQITFTMEPQAYNSLSNGNRPEVHTELTIDGIHYPDIGLKLKGSASYAPMTGKPAFIVDLNEWIPGQRFRGMSAFKLHNGNVLDPTRCRDYLTYLLARESGLMAPRVGWAEVWVARADGAGTPIYYGLYMVIERQDKSFIEYRHPTQGETASILEPNETTGWGYDFGSNAVQSWNHEEGPLPPDPATVASLLGVDEVVGRSCGGYGGCYPSDQDVTDLWTYADRELVLTYLAWENVVMHHDGYLAPNNWRVYVDGDTHKVSLLPSGAEWTWDMGAPGIGVGWYNGRLGVFCAGNAGCLHDYAAKLVEVADLADALLLDEQFEALSIWLDPYIDADPRYSSWETADETRPRTRGYMQSNPESARQWAYGQFPDLRP